MEAKHTSPVTYIPWEGNTARFRRVLQQADRFVEESRKWSDQHKLSYSNTLFSHASPDYDHLTPLAVIKDQNVEHTYNCTLYTDNVLTTAECHGVFRSVVIKAGYGDLFLGIKISCVNVTDIEHVRLSVRDNAEGPNCDFIPYKSIRNPTSPYIQFFDFPITPLHHWLQWRIDIFTTSKFDDYRHPVQMNYLICNDETRKTLDEVRLSRCPEDELEIPHDQRIKKHRDAVGNSVRVSA